MLSLGSNNCHNLSAPIKVRYLPTNKYSGHWTGLPV